jgi:uncharacterized protein (DUF3084 family)
LDGIAALFILGVIVLGGVSAWVADILGYKIGKKRLSLWKLRPKYVARISVTLAGMLIPLLTIALVFAASSDFRIWLTKGRQAIRELKEQSTKLEKVSQTLDARTKENAEIGQKNQVIQTELTKNKAERDRQKQALDQLAKTLNTQRGQLDGLQAKMSVAQTKISSLNLAKSQSVLRFNQAKSKLDKAELELIKDQRKLTTIQRELLDATNSRNISVNERNKAIEEFNQISRRNDDLTRTLAGLQKNIDGLQVEIDELKLKQTEAKGLADDAQRELEEVRSAVKKTIEENETLRNTNKQLQTLREDYANFSRTQALMFSVSEEVYRTAVPARLDRPEAQSFLANALRSCRAIASSRNAKENKAYAFSGSAGILLYDKQGTELPQSEVIDTITQQIQNGRETRVIVFYSFLNRFEGEPVTLGFDFHPNPIVFEPGQVIAEGRADGRESDLEIFAQIQNFVRVSVNDKAKRLRMVPVQGRNGESYGELSAAQILNAVSIIKSTGRVIRLQAVAQRQVRAGDPLTFELVIK